MKVRSSILARESPVGLTRYRPSLSAVPFAQAGSEAALPLLDTAEAERLAQIGSVVRFAKGTLVYQEGDEAGCIYNVIDGAVKTFCALSSGRRRVTAFLFAGDLAGLAENGHYVATAQAVSPVTACRVPLDALERILRGDPALGYRFLCKLCHDLRAAQSHAIMLGRRDAHGKLAMFLHELRSNQARKPMRDGAVSLAMTRSDIADYLGLSLEAVCRAFRKLQRNGIIAMADPHHVHILDRGRFDQLVGAT